MKKIMIVGSGQMGCGITQVFAVAGYEITMVDLQTEVLNKGYQTINHKLSKKVAKGQLTQSDIDEILDRISLTTELEEASDQDLIIEAAVENMETKSKIFEKLDKFSPDHAVLATNTSSLPITELAAVTNRPDKVIGMHFMNPVPVMKLVEVIRGLETSEETFRIVSETVGHLEKHAVEVKDFPGFVSNRVLMTMINEAIYCVYEGVSEPGAIDDVMKMGMNHPMGPLTLADFIGLDTCLYIMEIMHDGLGDPKYRPCPLLRKYVKAGRLGKKSGYGFYQYISS